MAKSHDSDGEAPKFDLSKYAKPDWVRACENPTRDNIKGLSKGELVWVASFFAGTEEPDTIPSGHNGAVTRSLLREIAFALGNPESVEPGFTESDEESDEEPDEESDEEEDLTNKAGKTTDDYTKDELVEYAEQMGVDTQGTKADIFARLVNDEADME